MKPHSLAPFFQAKHIAIIGASERVDSMGKQVLNTFLALPFQGSWFIVNPKHQTIAGFPSYADVQHLPYLPDLAVVCSPPHTWEAVIKSCVKRKITHINLLLANQQPSTIRLAHQAVKLGQSKGLTVLLTQESGLLSTFNQSQFSLFSTPIQTKPSEAKVTGKNHIIIGHQAGFSTDLIAIHQLNPNWYADCVLPEQMLALMDYAMTHTSNHVLIVQLPSTHIAEFFSRVKQAARKKKVIVCAWQQQYHNHEEVAILRHITERCGAYFVAQHQHLPLALTIANMPSAPIRTVYVLGHDETETWQNQAQTYGMEIKAHRLSRQANTTTWQNTLNNITPPTEKAIIVVQTHTWSVHFNPHLAPQHHWYLLGKNTPYRCIEDILQAVQAHNHWWQIQQNAQHNPKWLVTPLPINLSNHNLQALAKQPSAQQCQALHLPEWNETADGMALLQWKHHAQYGAYLSYPSHCGGRSQVILPPFQSHHAQLIAKQLSQSTNYSPKLLHELHSLLQTLNQLAEHINQAISADFVLHNHSLSTKQLTLHQHTLQTLFTLPPKQTELFISRQGEVIDVRAVLPEDAPLIQDFVRQLSSQARKSRFMLASQELPITLLTQFSQPDFALEHAFIALDKAGKIQGLVQTAMVSHPDECEFGIVVSEAMQGQGLAYFLMQTVIKAAKQQGYQRMSAQILPNNHAMLRLAEKLGFKKEVQSNNKDFCVVNLPLSQIKQ